MARKSLIDVAPRTVRVHIPSDNNILGFYRLSPASRGGEGATHQSLN